MNSIEPGRRRPFAAPAHLLAAGALTLSMVGDSLVYAVIPAAAATYGLSAVGISLVLSVNRFVRLAFNPVAARWLGRVGLRRGTVIGSVLALASTAGYALAPGLFALLAARVVWGAAFATLRLTMLGYATADPARSPQRVGMAVGVQEVAPAALLAVGASLLGLLGARALFALLALVTLFALPLALSLPRSRARDEPPSGAGARGSAGPPQDTAMPAARTGPTDPVTAHVKGMRRTSLAAAVVSFTVDGGLTAGVVLTLLANGAPPAQAAALGGLVLAARKSAQVVIAPVAGALAQRLGVTATAALAMLGAGVGLGVVALGAVIAGALLAVAAAAAVSALAPAALESEHPQARMRALGWLTTARDLGAASGAALAPLALVGAGAADRVVWSFGVSAGVVLVAAAVWWGAGRRRA